VTGVRLSYVLPLRWEEDSGLDELTFYLRWLAERAEVIVVDGSPPALFSAHAERWREHVRHVEPDPRLNFRNGKVNGVATGVGLAGHEAVVIADDDVRYDESALRRVVELLESHDLVRPQNYFDPLPWHAAWDSARSLLNRSVGRDYPGTLGIRRSLYQRVGGYDGDVLFENLELMRTMRAAGGREAAPLDLYVRRLPPETSRFLGQRVRQAYDEFALPGRLALWLGVVPFVLDCLARRRFARLGTAAAAGIAVAEVGRRRGGGAQVFPARASLFAPAWLLERGVCSWLAIAQRLGRGGVAYSDGILERAATPERELRRRLG
jgi:hypothetical protein